MPPEDTLNFEPATQAYVLEVLREVVRLEVGRDVLTAGSSVFDLVLYYDELAWPSTRLLAECMNRTFDVSIPVEEWKRAFPGLWGRTVRDVCEFLAPRIRRPTIRPWRFMAGECQPAGAFLALHTILAERGVSPDRLTPSSRTATVSYADLCHLFWKFNLIAPGRLAPPCEAGSSVGRQLILLLGVLWLLLGSSLGFVLATFGISTGSLTAAAVGLAMTISGIACGWVVDRMNKSPDIRASWREYPTFRDLAYCLAGQEPRRRLKSKP